MSLRRLPNGGHELAQFVRRTSRRLSQLESRPDGKPGASHDVPFTLGDYVLDVDDSGDLTATNVDTGTTTVIASP